MNQHRSKFLPGHLWKVERCVGDGNCLIYALCGDSINVGMVRTRWAQWLQAHLDASVGEITEHPVASAGKKITTIREWIEQEQDRDVAEYLQRLKENAYCGYLEMLDRDREDG